MEGKGRFADCLSIDRINPLKGYEHGNVRVIRVSENSSKASADKEARRNYAKQMDRQKAPVSDDGSTKENGNNLNDNEPF